MTHEKFPLTIVTCKDLSEAVISEEGTWGKNFKHLLPILDRLSPVKANLHIKETPPGFPPEEIRQAWVGITLPVRVMNVLVDKNIGIAVNSAEAIEALRVAFENQEPFSEQSLKVSNAFLWWQEYYKNKKIEWEPSILDEEAEDYSAGLTQYYWRPENADFLFFDPVCGRVETIDNQEQYFTSNN